MKTFIVEKNMSMIEFNQILLCLTTNLPRLKKDYHLKKIGVFGTMVRGEQSRNSDID
jgi:predicted nucleotidyltransferase